MATRGLLISALALTLSFEAPASEMCTVDAMLVFDGSGSMAETGFNQLDEPRIFTARRVLHRVIPRIAAQRRVGLVTYGPGAGEGCAEVDLRFGPRPDAAGPILDAIATLEPEGGTPLTEAVGLAADVLDHDVEPGVIVLVTDGRETCGGAPCRLAAELAAVSPDLTVHVIGFKVRGTFFSWDGQGKDDYLEGKTVARCLADRTGGLYLSTETADQLATALNQTLGCTVIGRLD
ncbi:MAG: vWA domain-containing protein [Pseudomonadota bacterium]